MKYRVEYGFDGEVWLEPDIDFGKSWTDVQHELHDHYTKLGMVFIHEGKAWLGRTEQDYIDGGANRYYKSNEEDSDSRDDL